MSAAAEPCPFTSLAPTLPTVQCVGISPGTQMKGKWYCPTCRPIVPLTAQNAPSARKTKDQPRDRERSEKR